MPTARPVNPHRALSICDDKHFFILSVFDHAVLAASPFFLPMMIELPTAFFVATFSFNALLFWASSIRVGNVYIHSCPDHSEFVKQCLPLGHMMNMVTCVSYIFTRLFVFSRNREHNKRWVQWAVAESITATTIQLRAIFRLSNTPQPRPPAAFWSRMEFFTSRQEERPLLLPANVGVAFKVSEGLKDWALYVWALALPIYFTAFEFMRVFSDVHPNVRAVMHSFFLKYVVFFLVAAGPHCVFEKAIHQGRVRAAWLMTSVCFVAIVVCVLFMKPGSARILPRNFRFWPFFVMSNVAPATMMRSISHVASARFNIAVFVVLHMCAPLQIFLLHPFILSCVSC
jgi:hypothetical protein